MSSIIDRIATCEMFGITWDTWENLSIEAKGIHLAYYREKRAMETWEAQEAERRQVMRSLAMRGKK